MKMEPSPGFWVIMPSSLSFSTLSTLPCEEEEEEEEEEETQEDK